MGYQRAICNIKAIPSPVTKAEQLKGVAYVGDKMMTKIKEYLAEGKMSKLEDY